MKKFYLLAVPALAASLSLAACGTSSPTPVATAHQPATSAPVATAPTATASPAGTWNVGYSSAPAQVLGQESITSNGTTGGYTITTKTAINLPDGHCSIPAGIEEGTFDTTSPPYSGSERIYEPNTCAFAYDSPFTATLSGNVMILQIANANPPSFTLTRVGSTPTSTPPVAAAPSPSPTDCLVPDITGNGSASAVAEYVKNAGFNPVVVQKSDPGNSSYPAGYFWETNRSYSASVKAIISNMYSSCITLL